MTPLQTPDQAPAPSLTRLQKANATLAGPKAPDMSPDVHTASMAIDRVEALQRAAADDIVFVRGGEIGKLGNLSVSAQVGAGEGPKTPTIKAARLGLSAPEKPAEPAVNMSQAAGAPAELPMVVQG